MLKDPVIADFPINEKAVATIAATLLSKTKTTVEYQNVLISLSYTVYTLPTHSNGKLLKYTCQYKSYYYMHTKDSSNTHLKYTFVC
jgi:hypothetical protein